RPFEEAFLYGGVPYTVVGSLRFYDRKEIKDLIAYLRVIYNPADNISLKRIINVPRRGIGETTVGKLELEAARQGKSLYQVLREIAAGTETYGVRAKDKIADFVKIIEDLRAQQTGETLTNLVEELLEVTGYRAELMMAQDEQAKVRLENINE